MEVRPARFSFPVSLASPPPASPRPLPAAVAAAAAVSSCLPLVRQFRRTTAPAGARKRCARSAGTRLSMTAPAVHCARFQRGIITHTYATLEYRRVLCAARRLSSVRSRRFSIRLVAFYPSPPFPSPFLPRAGMGGGGGNALFIDVRGGG